MTQQHETPPQKILLLSDTHIGGTISNLAPYQKNLLKLMTSYDHVVMAGDSWELFYVGQDHVKAMSSLLQDLTQKDAGKWKKQFEERKFQDFEEGDPKLAALIKKGLLYDGTENVINGAEQFTKEFLEQFPGIQLHVLGGNHESVRRFHNKFAGLEKQYENFEWSPEAIRLGDALITHGHLPLRHQRYSAEPQGKEEYKIARLREASSNHTWSKFLSYFGGQEQKIQEWKGAGWAGEGILAQLMKWAETGEFHVRQHKLDSLIKLNHEEQLVFADGVKVKHIIAGHTHVQCDNLTLGGSDVLYHNTGAMVKAVEEKTPGILEATLNANGTITDIHPVKIEKDPVSFYLAAPSGRQK